MTLSAVCLGLIMILQWTFSDVDSTYDLSNTVMTALGLILSYLAYNYIVLLVRGFTPRWVQTSTSIFSTHFIIHVIASPLVLLSPYLLHLDVKNPALLFIGVIYLFLTMGLSIWQFVVTAHIYKFALATTRSQSILVAFGLIAANILTVSFWR